MTAPDDGLDTWLAELSGKPVGAPAAAPQPEHGEAALLRRLMSAQRAQRERAVQAPTAASEAAHWQRLRLRLALAVGADTLRVEPARPRTWAANQPLWAWAAGLTAVAVLLPWALRLPPSGDAGAPGDGGAGVVMRGGAAAQVLQARTAADASALADRVERVLREHQQRYRRLPLGDTGWQFQAKVDPASAAAAEIAREGVDLPVGGLVNLQVVVEHAELIDRATSRRLR